MSFRFYRRVKLLPGVSLNFSKSGASVSLGPRGAKMTFGPRGVRQTVGIPGTGLYYTTTSSSRSRSTPVLPPSYSPTPPRPPTTEERLTLGFFKRLVTPKDEEELVAGMKAMVQGREIEAAEHFRNCADLADGAFLAGVLALKRKEPQIAAEYLELARQQADKLGTYLQKYGVTGTFELPVTEEIKATTGANLRGVLLMLTEAYQQTGRLQEAIDALNALYQLDPNDLVVRVSRAELLVEEVGTAEACQQVVELAKGVGASSEVEAALLLFKVRALRKLGLLDVALDCATGLVGVRKSWSQRLKLGMRYERGLIYEMLGQPGRSRIDFEFVYAEDPAFGDVAVKLGLQATTAAGENKRASSS